MFGGIGSLISNKITGTLQNMGEKPMSPEDFARLQGSIISGEAPPAPAAPAQKATPSGGDGGGGLGGMMGGGGGGMGGIMGMLGKGIGNLDSTGGSNFLEQAKNLIGGMFK